MSSERSYNFEKLTVRYRPSYLPETMFKFVFDHETSGDITKVFSPSHIQDLINYLRADDNKFHIIGDSVEGSKPIEVDVHKTTGTGLVVSIWVDIQSEDSIHVIQSLRKEETQNFYDFLVKCKNHYERSRPE